MLPTKFVLLLVAVLAVQISSRAAHSISPGEAIQRRLEEVTKSLDHELHTCKRKIQDAQHKVEELKESTISLANERFKSFVEPLLKEIEDFRKRGDQLHIDVSDCSEGREDELRKIPAQKLLKIGTCLNNSETAVFKEAQNTYDSLKATNDRLKELTAEIRECNGNYWFPFTRCRRDVEEAAKILFRVAKQITDADSIISSTKHDARQKFDQCTSADASGSEGYNKKAMELYGQILDCMIAKTDPCSRC